MILNLLDLGMVESICNNKQTNNVHVRRYLFNNVIYYNKLV